MKTYKLSREDGSSLGFEIENIYITRQKTATLLKKIDGVSDVQFCKLFSQGNDVRITFKYLEKECIVWEPYGDNSRYWIGSNNENEVIDFSLIENAFASYKPPFLVRLLGDLVSFKFLSVFKG